MATVADESRAEAGAGLEGAELNACILNLELRPLAWVRRDVGSARGLGHGLVDAHLASAQPNPAFFGCQGPRSVLGPDRGTEVDARARASILRAETTNRELTVRDRFGEGFVLTAVPRTIFRLLCRDKL